MWGVRRKSARREEGRELRGLTMEEQLHRFGFARTLREDAVTCCACFFSKGVEVVERYRACVNTDLVSSNECRNVLGPSLPPPSPLWVTL